MILSTIIPSSSERNHNSPVHSMYHRRYRFVKIFCPSHGNQFDNANGTIGGGF